MKTLGSQIANLVTGPEGRPARNSLIKFFAFLAVVISLFALIFHLLMLREGQEFTWLTGFYWTLTVMSTLGFGDITFHTDLGRLFTMVVLLTGIVLLLIVLPFVFSRFFYAPWLEAQLERKAPRSVARDLSGHVIVCKYDDVAQALRDRLSLDGVPTVMIEADPARAASLHDDRIPVVRGALDARSTFEGAGFDRARLLVANADDITNTNIVVTAREVSESVPVVAVVVDPDAMDVLELAGADHAVLVSKRLGEHLASRVSAGSSRAHVVGRYKSLAIAEFPIRRTRLAQKTLAEAAIRTHTGVTVTALARRGHLEPGLPNTLLREDCIGIAVGTEPQIEALNEYLGEGVTENGPTLVIGGGRVGRSAAEALRKRGVSVRLIEENTSLRPRIEAVTDDIVFGDAADHEVMLQAGINEAASVILTTNHDATNIFLAVYCRKLNPDTIVVSRVSHLKNIESIHRAGADFALSDPQIKIQSILSAMEGREPVILGEGLDLFNVEVPRSLHGRMLRETGILARTGLAVIAVERDGIMDLHPRPETNLNSGERVLFIGTAEQRSGCRRVFG